MVEWVGWFNHSRLHEALDYVPPAEFEQLQAQNAQIERDGSVTSGSPTAAEALTTTRIQSVDLVDSTNGADPAHQPVTPAVAVSLLSPSGLAPLDSDPYPQILMSFTEPT